MTYCVGLLLDAGIVMLSDTRTNAGVDNIAIYRKMFVYEEPGERALVMLTSGNLSITQTVMAKLEHAIEGFAVLLLRGFHFRQNGVELRLDLLLARRRRGRQLGAQLVGLLAQTLGAGAIEDHLTHPGKPVLSKEHVLGAAEPDALGAELAGLLGVTGHVRVGPHPQSAHFVGPGHEDLEIT